MTTNIADAVLEAAIIKLVKAGYKVTAEYSTSGVDGVRYVVSRDGEMAHYFHNVWDLTKCDLLEKLETNAAFRKLTDHGVEVHSNPFSYTVVGREVQAKVDDYALRVMADLIDWKANNESK